MIFDKEMEALVKCTDMIKELDDEARIRVVKYLIERFGIGFSKSTNFEKETATRLPNSPTVQQIPNSQFEESAEVINEVNQEEYPSLKDLVVKNYPKNEAEWILCYAFYSSKFGSDTFNRGDIIDKYKENNRWSKSASNNLNNNLGTCIKKDWIKSTNNSDYILKTEGIGYAKQILGGNSTGIEKKATKRKSNKVVKE